MERFTARHSSGIVLCPKNGTKECAPDLCSRCKHQIAAFNRLAEYEDTGLEPAEIAAMAKEHKQIIEQIDLQKLADTLTEVIPSIVQGLVENMPALVEAYIKAHAGDLEKED